MQALILASTSPYRRLLLERLRLPFEVVRPTASEAPVAGELPPDRAIRLCLAKAQAVATSRPGAVIIGSDQVAAVGSAILDKPGDAQKCRAQLEQLSGTSARFHTGCAVLGPQGQRLVHLDTTEVRFRSLAAAEIERYMHLEAAFDCAGGFKAEGLGVALFESVESKDPTALIGLPLIWLADALRRLGLPVP
ncbi:MAG TPA: nucleoside triphosphate pyrophosphatase [Steroidobacteraceae bacterium]|jgi:septum formation protein